MPGETLTRRSRYNDDGWAILKTNDRLIKERAREKFMIVLSDGYPEESHEHAGHEFELHRVVPDLRKAGKVKLIGLGVGRGTGHVAEYYPNSISNIQAPELPELLAELLRSVIEEHQTFIR